MKTLSDQRDCDQEQISRFHDGELSPQDNRRMEAHLKDCPDCQMLLADFDRLGHLTRRHADQALAAIDTGEMAQHILARMQKSREASADWRNWLKPGRLLIPVTVAALALAIFIVPRPFNKVPDSEAPSAIINSFTGSVTSVMLFETPNTHQTIIWFKEDSTANGENDAVENI
jgi:anti-sigma factor RsiW